MRSAHFFEENSEPLDSNEDQGSSHQKFRPISTFNPRGPTCLETFITNNYEATSKLPSVKHRRQNLSIEEKQAIKNLSSNRAIVIKLADKGSGVVIMNTQDYVREAQRQLSDTNFYEKLDSDPTEIFSMEIDNFLQKNGPGQGDC